MLVLENGRVLATDADKRAYVLEIKALPPTDPRRVGYREGAEDSCNLDFNVASIAYANGDLVDLDGGYLRRLLVSFGARWEPRSILNSLSMRQIEAICGVDPLRPINIRAPRVIESFRDSPFASYYRHIVYRYAQLYPQLHEDLAEEVCNPDDFESPLLDLFLCVREGRFETDYERSVCRDFANGSATCVVCDEVANRCDCYADGDGRLTSEDPDRPYSEDAGYLPSEATRVDCSAKSLTFFGERGDADIPRFFGMEVEISCVADPNPFYAFSRKWSASIGRDGSLPWEGYSFELRCPPVKGSFARDMLADLAQAICTSRATITPQCGLHVHVDVRKAYVSAIRRVCKRWQGLESTVFNELAPGRDESTYCEPWSNFIYDASEIDNLYLDNERLRGIAGITSDRYRSLNLQSYSEHKTLEFRLFSWDLFGETYTFREKDRDRVHAFLTERARFSTRVVDHAIRYPDRALTLASLTAEV